MGLIYLGAFLLMWYGIGKWVLEAVRLVTDGFAHIISSIRGEAQASSFLFAHFTYPILKGDDILW